MKKLITTTIFFILLYSCYSQIVEKQKIININSIDSLIINYPYQKVFRFDTFQIKNQTDTLMFVFYNNTEVDTKVIGYYKNGNKYREFCSKNGKLLGWDYRWYKDGSIWWESYHDSILTVPTIEYYNNGRIHYFSNIDKKKNSGVSVFWYDNGRKKEEKICIDTTISGFLNFSYLETGELIFRTIYNLGKQNYLYLYPNGDTLILGEIYNTEFNLVGKWHEWYEDGVKKREYFFDENQPNVKTGTWSWWDEEGKLIKQEVYKNNELIEEKKFLPFDENKN
ncbi:MAG TPA: hypothetical protein DCQ26_19160 [Marinilabiliales bacterium]|nr:MAG: hypothetical protein A2W95_09970 [Bacteroidetes bacterium GWA2_40_14]OFX64945.1 MAG: hypothetical protein A2W84_11640 [Bacteroidetes bacterium GWC2_40_13]OFX72503.1 MAG: hypothetical protein A2W96_05545 [Bacteroidetes bacterium GWD2_40_43]OFX90587.1 MAG: hypothetical protein A2W97_02315 [Bacteroidetes bacterium GWE2_40_63]OFY20935.1 MAG: hypothetical protein A2W88_17945 [Bacteroidetes bacterium GWF2_40_13]OFZ23646.1 MAG: hypothetical protein A2437_06285 [Bacteroidetes bacterium RIFOXYC